MGAITLKEYKERLKQNSNGNQNSKGAVSNQYVAAPNTISYNDYRSKYGGETVEEQVNLPTKSKKSKFDILKSNIEEYKKTDEYKQYLKQEEEKKKQEKAEKEEKEKDMQKLQGLLTERYQKSQLPTYSEKPSPFDTSRGVNQNRNVENKINPFDVKKQMENMKNYEKNDEIERIVDKYSEDKGKKLLDTGLSSIQIFGENALRAFEGVFDFASDITGGASDWVNTKAEKAVGMHKGKSEKEVNKEKAKARQEMIKTDYTGKLMDAVGKQDYKELIESNSLVKEDNLAGQIIGELGKQSVNILLTHGTSKALVPTENIDKLGKLGQTGVKLFNLATESTPIYATSYGQALQEAYQNGATQSEARRYAAGSAATETMTEWITSGIPGVKGTKGKGLDKWFEKLIGEELEQPSKTLTKALLKSGYKLVGESSEEVLSDLIDPYLKQFTYEYNSQKDALGNFAEASGKLPTKEDLLRTIVITAITTGILEAPSNISDISGTIKNSKTNNINIDGIAHNNNTIRNDSNINENETISNENTPGSINIPTPQNVPQNDLKLPTSTYQNTTYNEEINPMENLQEFNEQRQEKIERQQVEETNNKIDKLQKQVEELKGENNYNFTGNANLDFSNQVEQWKKGKIKENEHLVIFKETPKIYQQLGLSNRPITLTANKLDRIYNETGKQNRKYHGLGELIKQLPQALEHPLNVVESKDNSIVAITNLSDKNDNIVIASIKIDGNGQVEIDNISKNIPANVLTSSYGRENYDYQLEPHNGDYTGWMEENKLNDRIVYDIDEGIKKQRVNGQWLSLPNSKNSFSTDNNTTNRTKSQVSLPSQYNMQQKKNNIPTKKETNAKSDKVSIPMAKKDDVLRVASRDIAKQINDTGGFDLKQRSWIETSTESDVLKDKVYIDDLDKGKISYVVQSNKKSLDSANKRLDTYGYDKTLDYVKNIMQSDKLPSASDVALMQRMIQEASKRGDAETVQDLIMDTAIVGTDLGQATQALSIIQKLTPEGQLKMYTKLVQRAKARGEKSFQNVEITPAMVQDILEAYNKDGTYDQDDLNARVERFKQKIADQMKSTVGEKIDAWRYLSMLGNPKTHIRNMVSNIAMTGTIKVKNAMARTLETVLPVKGRTKTWKRASQEIKNYAKQTATEMKGVITGENKYNEKSAIESKKQIFKSKVLEKLSNANGNALEFEDWMFSKNAFKNTLEEYLTANGINTLEDIKNNPEVVEKAKLYAVEQAEIATFRQYSKLAATINQIERKNKGARLAIQALVPFKKTPINVAKAGVNYSPLGLSKNLTYDLWQLTHGDMEASQFIDKLSQGMTGTSLTLLGYALAKAGILTGSGGDNKDDKYDKQLGKTGYSLNIGGKSYSISWLSPVAMPMLVGSNAYEQLEEEKEWDMNVVSDTLAKTLDPLNEMSFMQSLTNALQSYGSGTDKIKGAGESTLQSYVGQFFPTLFSQIAAVSDDKKRSTKASNNSKYKFGEQTVRSVMYKLPGLRQQLEVATDVWGNEKTQSNNIIERAFESFIAPYSKTEDTTTKLDKEIKRVYNETGEGGVIPSVPYAYVRYKNQTYRMSANEYTNYKKTYGQNANKYLNNLISSSAYKTANDDMKAKMIDKVYDYVRAEANEQYFKGTDVDYSNDELKELKKLRELNINSKTLPEYIANKTQISSIRNSNAYTAEQKKNQVKDILVNSKLENNQLSYLYGKYYSTEDKLKALSGVNMPIKEFIKYDLADFTSDYNSRNGKAITGSREKKVINYVNSLNLSVAQKALLIKMEYNSYKRYDNQIINYVKSSGADYLDKAYLLKRSGFKNYDKEIINYVKQHYNTVNEREEILKNLGFTVRNGRVY